MRFKFDVLTTGKDTLMTSHHRQVLHALALVGSLCLLATPPASAQQPATARGVEVILLGTAGGPLPQANRSQAATAIISNGQVYLFDAGNGTPRQFPAAGIESRRVGHIFITHHHDDHNADVGTLVGLSWSNKRKEPIRVFGPPGTTELRAGFLRAFSPSAQIRNADFGFYQVSPEQFFQATDIAGSGPVYSDDNITVTAVENCHYHFSFPQHATGVHKSYAYKVRTGGKTIVISGDTGPCEDQLVPFTEGADMLVHEVINLPLMEQYLRGHGLPEPMIKTYMRHMVDDHSTPAQIGSLARKAGVKRVVLTHFVPGSPSDSDAAYADDVRANFAGEVTVGKDLTRLTLP
jgi:ribonuclease BN (tRNA processing enzyme)